MKRLFAITVVLMTILMSLGCAASVPETTATPTAGQGSLVTSVGNRPFVGHSGAGTLDLNGWSPAGGR